MCFSTKEGEDHEYMHDKQVSITRPAAQLEKTPNMHFHAYRSSGAQETGCAAEPALDVHLAAVTARTVQPQREHREAAGR